jgi:hypothetical protein
MDFIEKLKQIPIFEKLIEYCIQENGTQALTVFLVLFGYVSVAFVSFVYSVPASLSVFIGQELYFYFCKKLLFILMASFVSANFVKRYFDIFLKKNENENENECEYEYKAIERWCAYFIFSLVFVLIFNLLVFGSFNIFDFDGKAIFYSLTLIALISLLYQYSKCNGDIGLFIKKLSKPVNIVLINVSALCLGLSIVTMNEKQVFTVKTEYHKSARVFVIATGSDYVLGYYADHNKGYFFERGTYRIELER